jgi:hypothetical protein
MKNEPFLIANKAECSECGDIIVSKHNHDYQCCSCNTICIDGGFISPSGNWVKNPKQIINRNVYSDAPFEEIRKNLYRNGTTLLCDQNDNWLKEMISYERMRNPNGRFLPFYIEEYNYRIKNKIQIKDE